MDITTIGRNIAELRKLKGVKQDDLARFVGVTAQAVSKWENGGVPDTELLPKIADFFEISIDKLFGREYVNGNITSAIFEHIRKTKPDSKERFKAIFELCWDIERSIFNFQGDFDLNSGKIKDYERMLKAEEQQYSSILSDYGFTRMGIANKMQYFLMVPEIKDKQLAFLQNIDYTDFFKDLSDRYFFDSLLLLFKRDCKKAFTEKLLVKELGVDSEKSSEIIKLLKKYRLVNHTQIELDNETKDIYSFFPTPSFIALLIFAQEMINRPNHFSFFSDGRSKPYLA